ncbi:MAG: DUF1566 domain-containing protein [Desulfatirhabdiaceae bacterium]
MEWEQALSYCENLSPTGYTGWWLPTIKELRSIKDYSRNNPVMLAEIRKTDSKAVVIMCFSEINSESLKKCWHMGL